LEKLFFLTGQPIWFEKYMLFKEQNKFKSGIKIAKLKQKVGLFCFLRNTIDYEFFFHPLPPDTPQED
jgi:hypothetical protein